MKAYTNRDVTRWNPLFDALGNEDTLIVPDAVQIMAAPRFHMPSYLMGTPERVYLMNTGEVCQTQYDASDRRHAWFVKNGNSEEFAVFDSAVWRFTDTSPNEQEYYQQWRTTGQPGAKWCPEWWGIGEPYLRECEVRFFNKVTGAPSRNPSRYIDVTYLEIIAHHPVKGFPGGIAISDVLELAWYSNPGAKLERYWYARGWGLVGFSNAQGFASYVTKKEFAPAPTRKHFTGVVPMVLPPIEKEPEEAPQYVRRELNTKDNVRLRKSAPDGAVLIVVPAHEIVDVDVNSAFTPPGTTRPFVKVRWLDERNADAIKLYTGVMGILDGMTVDTQFKDVLTGEQPIPDESEPPIDPPPPDDDTQENPAVKLATVDYVDQKIEDSTEYTAAKFEALNAKLDMQARRLDALERLLRGLGPYVEKELPLAG